MTGPTYQAETALVPPPYVRPEERAQQVVEEGESLASIIDAAEAAKRRKDFPEAIRLFRKAIDTELESKQGTAEEKKPDLFLAQRLALVTYKNGETRDADGNMDKERAIAALGEAEEILERYCAPKLSTDPETLGLSGAINKRLFDHTGDLEYLDRSIGFYERGFYVKQDYYNGINVAFMYTMRSLLLEDRFEAIVSFGHANMIREKVGEICQEIIDSEEFHSRGDKEWVLMTLAEVYQGLGQTADEERLARKIEAEASDFGMDSYMGQKAKLAAAIDEFNAKVRPDELAAAPAGDGPAPTAVPEPSQAAGEPPAASAAPAPAVVSSRLAASGARATALGGKPITIDADLIDKPIRSIEVNCKIEYE
jgi:tetratricopeptide (TPR) repeat protein